jgi:hypothetical protein
MSETTTLSVTTYVFGMGAERKAPPVLVPLSERTVTARTLIAEHVRAEVRRVQDARTTSLALHYLLADDPRRAAPPLASLDAEAETGRAYQGLRDQRYVLVVDGAGVHDLDAPLTLTERSVVCFVRLLPLIGG